MDQRLATTVDAPAAKNARANEELPSVADIRPLAVLHPDKMTSLRRLRFQRAMSLENTAPGLPAREASTRCDIVGASARAIAWPAKWRMSIVGARDSSARSVASGPIKVSPFR